MVGVHQALLARNVEYSANSVGTRHGYGRIPDLSRLSGLVVLGGIVEIYNWIAPFSQISSSYADSALVYVSISGSAGSYNISIQVRNLNITINHGVLTGQTLVGSVQGGGASIVGVGMRLYVVPFDRSQQGISTGIIFSVFNNAGAVDSTGGWYNTFSGPSSYTPATSEPAAGFVTAGVHRIGYLIEYSSGFTTRVSPDSGATFGNPVFAPISVTASGAKNLRVSFALNWNTGHLARGDMVAVSIVMTTTTNLNQYYVVPGSRTTSDFAGAAAFHVDVSISDADLSSQGIDATPYLFWLTQAADNDVSGADNLPVGAPAVRHICLFGNRMAYLLTQTDNNDALIDAIAISEPNNYQAITADQHIVQLPGQKTIISMFRMGAADYILGPHEIWSLTDNNDVPVTWAAAQLIDGRHGTQAIHGVEVSPSGNYAWIADQGGLYLFTGGPITSLPVSYYQTPDWNRINWAKAYCVKIEDDASNKRVHVMVPLDGASTPSHIMSWDYTNGISAETVMYSLDSISGYSLGAMELVRNDLLAQATGNAGKIELWLASTGVDYLLRKMSDADFRFYRRSDSTLTSIVVAANVATATTAAAHGLWIGRQVTVAGATVDTDLNGVYSIVAVPTSTTFTFRTVSVANATYTESTLVASVTPYQDCASATSIQNFLRLDSTLTSITVAANVATVTTAAAHGLTHTGQQATVVGATVDTDLNGTYSIATIPTSTTFTFATAAVADATYTEATLAVVVSPYQDGLTAIAATYRGCPLPGRGVSQGQILMHHGFHARLKGAGTLAPTIYDIDAANSFACWSLTLATAPDKDELFLARMRNELSFVEFTSNAIDSYFILSYLRWYYSPYLMQR